MCALRTKRHRLFWCQMIRRGDSKGERMKTSEGKGRMLLGDGEKPEE